MHRILSLNGGPYRAKQAPPRYCRQRQPDGRPDQAFVRIDGRKHWLGPYGTTESHEQYERFLAEWRTRYCRPSVPKSDITVVEVIDRFMQHAETYYRNDRGPTSEIANFKLAAKPVKELYATLPACEFTSLRLEAVRDHMVKQRRQRGSKLTDATWTRPYINRQVKRIRQMFRWAASKKLIDVSVIQELATLDPLKRGRTDAPEPPRVRPVDPDHVNALKPFLTSTLWAMVQVQRWTGCRSGELVQMRPMDLDMSGDIWVYQPRHHKTSHHGYEKRIYIGPKLQAMLTPLLTDRAVDAPMFCPRDSLAEINAKAETHRRADQKPNRKKSKRSVRDAYDTDSYRRAITTACKRAGVPHWHPHQLRHLRLTEVRRAFGIEGAQVVGGHKCADVTQVYAEVDERLGVAIAREAG